MRVTEPNECFCQCLSSYLGRQDDFHKSGIASSYFSGDTLAKHRCRGRDTKDTKVFENTLGLNR